MGDGGGDSEEVLYPQLKLMRQLLIEIVKEESWIKVAGEAQESETRESVQATSDLVVIATGTSRAIDRPSAMSCWKKLLTLRIIAVTRHEIMPFAAWLGFTPAKSNHRTPPRVIVLP